jgi:EAL domain-containing protein (putative c-di-GMP-specific phosphodiesterase class I)
VNFFINFLPTAIYNPEHCLQTTLAAIRGSNIDPSRITFEVVETEHVGDYEHLVKVLRFYREQGFKVALDDVGAGYSSLLSLRPAAAGLHQDRRRVLPPGGRVGDGGADAPDLTAACEQNGITTIAEGVETPDQLAFLVDAGVTITQGWIHCRPAATPPAGEALRQMLDRADQIARAPRPSRAAS